jgi:hypothetical protein
MSNSDVAAAEELVLGWLREEGRPMSPIDLLRRPRPHGVSPLGIRNALWNIVDRGQARVTRNHYLEPADG